MDDGLNTYKDGKPRVSRSRRTCIIEETVASIGVSKKIVLSFNTQ